MFKSDFNQQRRRLLKKASIVAVTIPVTSLVGSQVVFANDTPMVDEKSEQAIALQYVTVSATDGQACNNCALYQVVDGAEDAGKCPLFQGSLVADTARCTAYAPKG